MNISNNNSNGTYQIITSRIEDNQIHLNKSYATQLEEVIAAILNETPFGTSSRLNGVLFKGLPGTGKTYTAKWIRTIVSDKIGQEVPMFLVGSITSPEDVKKLYAEARAKAGENGRCIIFDDEVEKYGKRETQTDPTKSAILNQIFMELDGAGSKNTGVITLAATNRPNAIDPAYRRGKRMSKEIYFDPLDKAGREHMTRIEALNKDHQFIYNTEDLDLIVSKTFGSVGADISQLFVDASTYANLILFNQVAEITKRIAFEKDVKDPQIIKLCEELSLKNLTVEYKDFVKYLRTNADALLKEFKFEKEKEGDNREYQDKASGFLAKRAIDYLNPNKPDETNSSSLEKSKAPATRWIQVKTSDIEHVLEHFIPSALKDMPFEETDLKFGSFGGLDKQINYLQQIINHTISQEGKDGTTIYMYGKEGNGVTSLAKAVAGEYGYNLIVMHGADTEDRFVGVVKDRLLEINERAKATKPCIVVFDNLKYLVLDQRIVDQSYKQTATSTIKQIIKPSPGVIYIATGESLTDLNEDILGLFHRTIEVTNPQNAKDYAKIWQIHLDPEYLPKEDINLAKLGESSIGLTGGDIYRICKFFPEMGATYSQEKLENVAACYQAQRNDNSTTRVDDVKLSEIILK